MAFLKTDCGHAFRVAELSRRIAEAAGLQEPLVSVTGIAALFHDIGKTRIPAEILLKPGKLTPSEYEIAKTHTTHGHEILSRFRNKPLRLAATVALTHHERLDGSGYMGLKDKQIGIPARIVAVADVFDALCNNRPYRKAIGTAEALQYLQSHAGAQFDRRFVVLLTRLMIKGGWLFP